MLSKMAARSTAESGRTMCVQWACHTHPAKEAVCQSHSLEKNLSLGEEKASRVSTELFQMAETEV